MTIDYAKAFSPSFGQDTFTTKTIPGIDYSFGSKLNLSSINFAKAATLAFNPIAFDPSLNLVEQSPGWTFITAPENISWDVNNQADRVPMFGTNSPPVVAGTRGMRDLKLGNALVEGFIRNVTVEGKIAALENLLNYKLNATDGFVSVPVYQVFANSKAYGNGYFIIKDVSIKETMRDLRGDATRAFVDISLMEVPEYQVNSGRDQASKTTAGVKSSLLSGRVLNPATTAANASPTKKANDAAKAAGNQGVGTSKSKAGANSATQGSQPSVPAVRPTGNRPIY